MLTPQEAEGHVFQKASFGGYNMLQVDNFLDSLIEDYRTLYQENLSLKNKMKVLVDKIEEYRSTEEAMRRALHSAQKMADEMVKEGQTKRQAAIDDTVNAVKRASEETRAQMAQEEAAIQAEIDALKAQRAEEEIQLKAAIADEQGKLEAAKASTAAYVAKLKELYERELAYIDDLSELAGPVKAAEAQLEPVIPADPDVPVVTPEVTVPEEERQAVAEDIEASMAKIFDTGDLPKETQETPAQETPAQEEAAPAEDAAPAGLGDTQIFQQIEFGKNIDVE